MDKELYLAAGEKTGVMKAMAFNRALAEAAEFLAIKDALDCGVHKHYGLTASEFCKLKGTSHETYKRRCTELASLGKDLWVVAKAIGFGAGQIQALAALPEGEKSKVKINGKHIEIGEEKVALDDHAKLQEVASALLTRAVEAEKDKKAQQKLTDDFRKNNEKLLKDIERYENRDERYDKNPNAMEEEFIVQMEGFKLTFNQMMKRVDPETDKMREFFRDEDENGNPKKHRPTMRMRACYLETLGYVKKMAAANYGMAEDLVGTADMFPENVWQPGEGAKVVDAVRDRATKKDK